MQRFALVLCAGLLAGPTVARAAGGDPDWPCMQRKVPELSMAQVWNGPELPASAEAWASDPDVAELVKNVSARRVPLDEASGDIRTFAGTLQPGQASERLGKLAQGLFDHMNAERAQVISGIGRYARKQIELAATLRKEASDLGALRAKADASAAEVTERTERLTWETRVFEERVQSLTYVCEVPTLIEQRLYALSKTVAEAMKAKDE